MTDQPASPATGGGVEWWLARHDEAPDATSEEIAHARHLLGNLVHYNHGRGEEASDIRTIVAAIRLALSRNEGAAEEEAAYQLGKRDGYEEAVQEIDLLTGGDGEYRFCTNQDPERHVPDPAAMKAKIAERFAALAAAPASPADGGGGELQRSKEWWLAKARQEGDHPIAAGMALPEDMRAALELFKEQLSDLAAWRPICTAERDGSHILAKQNGFSFGRLNNAELPDIQTVVHWHEDGWYTSVNEQEPQRPFPATHWKPLDEPVLAALASRPAVEGKQE